MTQIHRRHFVSCSGAALSAAAISTSGTSSAKTPHTDTKPVAMKLGTQEPTSEENFARFQRYGIKNVCGWYHVQDQGRNYPTVEELDALTALGDKYGIRIDMIDSAIGRGDKSAIMLGTPGRDQEIEDFQLTIKNCASSGIPTIKYYLSILPIMRLIRVPGRGDTLYNSWNYARASNGSMKPLNLGEQGTENAATRAGHIDSEIFWERIVYFLDRVIPVANEYKIRLAQHPHDPGLPAQGFMGVPNVLGTVEGLKRFVSIKQSPYHGLNFCQGTICENLDNPRTQIFDVIRWFGERKKIFNVHLRNIKGNRDNFIAECFPDDGDIDLAATVRTYQDIGYDGMLMPDHVPVPNLGDDSKNIRRVEGEEFVFAYGYIKGLIQAAGDQS